MQPSNTPEEWRPVVGYEGLYEVSDHGNVRSVDRVIYNGSGEWIRPGVTLAQFPATSGHLQVSLCQNSKKKTFRVHRLVLEVFVGPCPEGMEACHWDDEKTNNRLTNLRWASKSDNMHDRVRNGRHYQAVKTHCRYGHEFTPDNTIIRENGTRRCRECARRRAREFDARAGARIGPRRTPASHCKHGHEFSDENTYVKPNGTRACRTCKAETNRRLYEQRKKARDRLL